jgi:NAD(P)-dependent dehydrogenase (short-subunit alcohol dehydrogenase family)
MANQTVLVTGGAKRIGKAIVEHFSQNGYSVLIHVSSSLEEGNQLAEQLRSSGAKADVIQADLTDERATEALVELVENHPFIKQRDGLDVLVHNASKYSQIPLEDLTVEDMRVMNRLHVESPLQLTQGLALCLSSIEGSVVALTDTSEGQHWEKLTHYTASKAGLRQLMLGLAGELAPRVRVNCVGPGAILSADWEQEHFDNVLQRVPLRRSGTPADIASAVFFLANASYITGQELKVDGGWTLSP